MNKSKFMLQALTHLSRKRICHVCKFCSQSNPAAVHSTDTQTALEPAPRSIYRTKEINPKFHTTKNEGQFYTIDPVEVNRIFYMGGIPLPLVRQFATFGEVAYMIRRPGLEVIQYLETANYAHPSIRYILYGPPGVGKSLQLAYIMHYAATNNFFVIHVPDANNWNKRHPLWEKVPSVWKPGRIDYPADAAQLLKGIVETNAKILKEANLRLSQTFTWSKREVSEEGSPLVDMLDLGLNRVKYATDIVGAFLKEIKIQASQQRVKVLIAIDHVNCWFHMSHPYTMKRSDQSRILTDDVSLIHNFKKILRNDWSGGAVVCTLTHKELWGKDWDRPHLHDWKWTPRVLLTQQGFELFDPYVPVEVSNYTEREYHCMMDYLVDKNWLTTDDAKSVAGRKEIWFLTAGNPGDLQDFTRGV